MVKYNGTMDFQALAVCSVALFVKMVFVAFFTGWARSKEGTPATPEDAKSSTTEPLTGHKPNGLVERGLNMHRNDLENIPIFLILAILLLLSSLLGAGKSSHIAHIVYYSVFTFSRFAHTALYMFGVPKIRSAMWSLGLLTTFAVGIHLIVQVFNFPTVREL